MAQQNLLLYLANEGFGQQDGDGIQLEDSATGAIVLDGTEPTPGLAFIVQEDTGENIVGNLDVTVTARNGAAISTDQAKFGSASIEFDGSNDSLRTSDIILGTDNFTFEAFIRLDALTGFQYLLDGSENVGSVQNPVLYLTSTNILLSYAGGTIINASHGLSINTWHHIALVRTATQTFTIYVDGVQKGQATLGNYNSTARQYSIGNSFSESFGLNGYMDEIRLTKRAVYTSAFTPPTAEFSTGNENDQLIIHANGNDGSTTIVNSLGVERTTANAGDNFIQETGTVGSDTDRIIAETSILTFTADQRLNVGEKLLQDNPTNTDDLPLTTYDSFRFVDIRRSSKILLEQEFFLTDGKQLFNKIIAERDGVTPMTTEDDLFLVLEDSIVADELYPNRVLTSGQSNIDAGSVFEDGIALEESGFLLLDATNEGTEVSPDIKNQGGRLLTEEFESIILEVGGSFIQEQYSGTRIHAKLMSEDSISGKYLRLEKTLDPEPADGIQAESGTADVITDNIVREDGDKILIEQQEDDNELLIQNILLEETNIEEEEGQIPHENYGLSLTQDRPQGVVTQGMQPIVRSSYIVTKTA